MKWGLLLLLAACETSEVKRLEELRADLDSVIAERKACFEEKQTCLLAPRQQAAERARLQKALPLPSDGASFRSEVATQAAMRGLTLEIRFGAQSCEQPLTLTLLGDDGQAAQLGELVSGLGRMVWLER